MEFIKKHKDTVDFIQKILVIITLLVSIVASCNKLIQYMNALKINVVTQTNQIEKQTEVLTTLTNEYVSILNSLNKEISDMDTELAKTYGTMSFEYQKLKELREMKANDRLAILEKLGGQITVIKLSEDKK